MGRPRNPESRTDPAILEYRRQYYYANKNKLLEAAKARYAAKVMAKEKKEKELTLPKEKKVEKKENRKPEKKAEKKPEKKPEKKFDKKPEKKAEKKAEVKAEVKAEDKPETKIEVKSAPKQVEAPAAE